MGQTVSTPTTPISPSLHSPSQPKSGGCPIDHTALPKSPVDAALAKCPVEHTPKSESMPAQRPIGNESLNPDNQMPNLPQQKAPGQMLELPVDRTVSSIPRDAQSRWDYPSPQQFYNALVRKGWETPEEHIETMVHIHNFLNEEAWQEVLKWEKRQYDHNDIQLLRFKGRPGEMSPKARFFMLAGRLYPSKFNTEPPFDRHDWIVRRPRTGEEVRYVIDYYSAPPEADGSPVFSLDVRPALDSFSSLKERLSVVTEEAWQTLRESSQKPPGSTTKA